MPDYRFLLLDADGTFLDFACTERIALENLFGHFGIPHTREMLESYHSANSECWKALEEGRLSMEDLETRRFTLFFEKEGLDIDASQASEVYIDELAKAAFYIDGAEELLERLSKDFCLVVVTNGIPRVQRGRLERLGAMKYFKAIVISGEIGASKPSTAFFDRTLEIIGARKEECLVIGDSLTSDMKGALDSGIDALYLHLGKDVDDAPKGIKYTASSYNELVSVLY